jgi:hypothetical protein
MVCHLRSGIGKWNKIGHRLFSFMTQNRRRPFVSYQTVVHLPPPQTTVFSKPLLAMQERDEQPRRLYQRLRYGMTLGSSRRDGSGNLKGTPGN